MDYEKAYKEALERAKEQLKEAKVFDYEEGQIAHDIRTTTYAIFPELKESEDEKIRKEIISFLEGFYANKNKDRWIAWLEKQDPKKFEWKLEKQGEQKPMWSKEDITNYSKVLFCLQTLTFPTDVERKELITWLKKQCEQNSTDSYCKDNCKGFQETGKCCLCLFSGNGYGTLEKRNLC